MASYLECALVFVNGNSFFTGDPFVRGDFSCAKLKVATVLLCSACNTGRVEDHGVKQTA